MKKPTCDCGNECYVTHEPNEILSMKVPFTKIEIHVWNWANDIYSDMCLECYSDEVNEPMRKAYDAGMEDAMFEFCTE